MAKQEKMVFDENIIEKSIDALLPQTMLPYSEYVIMERALPRVEDGLKPVQRRILFTMKELNLAPSGTYKKSARIVGDCLGKYHPHGDTSVYEAMVRMAQDFNTREVLVNGHGNFGSMDGDSAAAMRYTEVKLAPLAMELLRDLDKNTVKFTKNFDDTLNEPTMLPGRFPNLLVNGALGIAIGLATNIPTHNLAEVIDGCIAFIENPKISLDEMIKHIPGPDFPTGGYIVGTEGIRNAYETGKGKIVMRAKVDIENAERERQNIVITEVPYQVDTSTLRKKIYDLKETSKEICGNIQEVQDESDKNGLRIVVKLKKGEDAVKIANHLIKKTALETNFNANMVAIANGKPQQLSLLEILKYYIEYQRNIVKKRAKFDLDKAKEREEILQGYLLAFPNIDEVIAIIRSSSNRNESKSRLKERFELTDRQADAILNLQLGNINRLDVNKFESELNELMPNIANLDKIYASNQEQLKVVKKELTEIRDNYRTKRKTTIISNEEEIEIKPYDPTKRMSKRGVVAVDIEGRVKFMLSRHYSGGMRDVEGGGILGLNTSIAMVEPSSDILIFSNYGKCFKILSDSFKEKRWSEKGETLKELSPEAIEGEKAVLAVTLDRENLSNEEFYLYTKLGMVKKTLLKEYLVNKDCYEVCVLKEGDEIIGGEIVKENSNVLFITDDGMCLNSYADEYPTQGRKAGGVIGINLNDNQNVVFAGQTTVELEDAGENGDVYMPLGEALCIMNNGFGKRVILREIEPLKRNRKGVKLIDTGDTNRVIFGAIVLENINLALIDKNSEIVALDTETVRIENRTTKGKNVLRGFDILRVIKHNEDI